MEKQDKIYREQPAKEEGDNNGWIDVNDNNGNDVPKDKYILLSFVDRLFLYILIGFIFHEILDFIHIVYYGYSLKHIGSQTYNLLAYLRK